MQPPPPYPPAAAPGNDRTTLFGVLGIIIGLICCQPVGIVFGVLSMQQAKRYGKPNTLGIIAIVLSIVSLVGGGIYYASR